MNKQVSKVINKITKCGWGLFIIRITASMENKSNLPGCSYEGEKTMTLQSCFGSKNQWNADLPIYLQNILT